MNRIELVLAGMLILLGLICLTMSGTLMSEVGLTVFLKTFVQICLWMCIPFILIGLLYWRYTGRGK